MNASFSMNGLRTLLLAVSILCLPALLALGSGCTRPDAAPAQLPPAELRAAASPFSVVTASPSSVTPPSSARMPVSDDADSATPSGAPVPVTIATRLLGSVTFTARPRAILDPVEASSMPPFQADPYAWTPRETVEACQRDLDSGTLDFRESLFEAATCLPPLAGATVADVGAGRGNNLLHWKALLGSKGRLIETEVDINLARFMAYAARKRGYAEQTMIVHSVFANPCLPVGQLDLVLCSQLHNHITIGPWPRNPKNEAVFRKRSEAFLGATRDALKDTGKLLVIEGYQEEDKDPQRFCLTPDEAISNIERNGFRLLTRAKKPHLWVAVFRKASR